MGTTLFLIVLWFVFAFGETDKGTKFWSYQLITPTIWVLFIGIAAFFDSSDGSPITLGELGRIMVGLAVGLTAVVTQREQFSKKVNPTCAGITRLLMVCGWTLLVIGVIRWLNR